MDERTLPHLRVAVIHYWLTGMRGGEKVVEALCRIFPQADIYTHVVRPEALSETITSHPIHTTFIQKLPGSVRHYQKYLPLMPLALEQLDLRGYDLVISSESGPAKGVITRADTPHICYCHSPMRYLWDFYQDYLESAGAVTRRVKRWWGKEAAVIHPPVDISRFSSPHMAGLQNVPGTPEPGSYYLCLSELVSYKRVDLAVEACTRTGRRLVVAGDGPERKRLESIAGPTVSFVGRVDNAALPALYAGCKAFLFPGEEDFGITPLEAMAAGRPVIAYGRGGVLDSVADGETGIFFERQTADALTEALDAYEASTEQTWVHDKLKMQAESFSEEIFRKKMIAFIADVLENKV